MMRTVAIALLIVAALPTLAAAEPPPEHKPAPRARVVAPGPGIAHPHDRIGGPVGPHIGGLRVGPGAVVFRGRPINRVHLAPFVYPHGWEYRRWAVGAVLPPLFLAPAYFYADWATLGLDPPQPGFQWVRYGPDLLLVNVTTGAVVDTVYGVFS
jgi:hypothetical protein